jgi:hypothetical protein
MTRYTHTGNGGPVLASDARHAAEILARRMYGRRRGTVAALRHDSDTTTRDGRIAGSTWEAFVGRGPTTAMVLRGKTGVDGRNVWIYS